LENQTYNDQKIAQYLLSSLPDEETKRFDELSFIDDDFEARLQAVEDDLADAYVRGELSGQELERFESQYVKSPVRSEKVKIARAFQAFADREVAARRAEAARAPVPTPSGSDRRSPWWLSLLAFLSVPRPKLQWGFAGASLLLLAAVGWLGFAAWRLQNRAEAEQAALRQRERELQTQLERQRAASSKTETELAQARQQLARLEQQQAPGEQRAKSQAPRADLNIAHFEFAPQTRNIGQVTEVSIPTGTDYVAFHLPLESDDYPAYRARLRSLADNRIVWSSGKLKTRARGDGRAIDLNLPASLLEPRRYTLEVTGVSASGAEEGRRDYTFRVLRQ
jgi:hypothetical protein